MIGIYAIKNTKNNKHYIGQSFRVERRWIEHKSALNNNRHINIHLQFSWNKNKSECFEFVLLEECLLEELDEKEIYWINKLNSYKNGYNLDTGGQGIKNYKHTEREIYKMRMIQNPMCILQFDLNNILVKEWIGGSVHIRKELHYTKECIDGCCNHTRKSNLYKGYFWVYKEEYESDNFSWDKYFNKKITLPINISKKHPNKMERKVNKYDMNLICTYDSITSASKDIGVYTSNISAVLSNSRKSCSGYKWSYAS